MVYCLILAKHKDVPINNCKYLALISFFIFSAAHADLPTLQNSVEKFDPGRAAEEIRREEEFPVKLESNIIKIPAARPSAFQGATGAMKFKCKKILLVGNITFSRKQLATLYADKINTEISLLELDNIAQKITDYYRNAGYIISQAIVPAQEISEDGVVKIQIIEGYISKVNITGCKSGSVCNLLQQYGSRISKSRPLKLETLERYSFLANDIPGVDVRTVLTKSDEHTGASDITLIVSERSTSGYIAYNNYSSTVLGRQQVLANATVYNFAKGSESSVYGIISTLDDRLRYIAINHSQQLNSDGLGINIAVSEIKTNPNIGSIGLENFYLPGTAFTATIDADYAWIRSHSKNLYIGAGFKFLNSFTEYANSPLFKDDLRSINAHVLYNFTMGHNNFNSLALNYSQGLQILEAKGAPPSRLGEQVAFSKATIYVSNMHKFNNSKFNSIVAAKAQYAFNIMPSSETFGYGGIPFGSGYDPSEFTGDHGISARMELQYSAYQVSSLKLVSQFFAFIDGGYVWNINKSIEPTHQSGASTGLGHRINAIKHLDLDFIVAAPLHQPTISGSPNYVRFLFNVKLYA